MPDPIADSRAVYPWQVLVDITDGAIIGLIARYDPVTPIDVIKAAIDDRTANGRCPDSIKVQQRLGASSLRSSLFN